MSKNNDAKAQKLLKTLKIIFIINILVVFSLYIFFICYRYYGTYNIFYKTLAYVITFLFFCIFILFHCIDKQKKKVMKNSIQYYKQRFPFYGLQIIVIFVCFVWSAELNQNYNVDVNLIFNINVSLISLNFLVLTFIVPFMKNRIEQQMKNIKTENTETKGKVYNIIQKYNHAYLVVFISVILFFVYVVTLILNDETTSNLYLLASMLYNSYVLMTLITSIKTIFWINIKEVEKDLEDNIDDTKTN